MQHIPFVIKALQNPWFWGFVIFPVLFLLALWPAIIGYLEDKASRIERRIK